MYFFLSNSLNDDLDQFERIREEFKDPYTKAEMIRDHDRTNPCDTKYRYGRRGLIDWSQWNKTFNENSRTVGDMKASVMDFRKNEQRQRTNREAERGAMLKRGRSPLSVGPLLTFGPPSKVQGWTEG